MGASSSKCEFSYLSLSSSLISSVPDSFVEEQAVTFESCSTQLVTDTGPNLPFVHNSFPSVEGMGDALVQDSVPNDEEADSDSSHESFNIVSMGFGQRLGQLEAPSEWTTNFSNALRNSLYFGDYLALFRQPLRSLHNKPKEQASTLSSLTVGQSLLFN